MNIGKPQKNEKHDKKAEKLLKLIKDNLNFILLPPVRDSKSSAFNQKITHSVKASLAKVMNHSRRAGAPKEYRLALAAIEQIAQIVELNTGEIKRSNDSPLASMLRSSEVRVELFPKDILDLIEKSMYVYLSTGEHDELKVLPNEVGNGLQSLIDINQTIESILVGDQNKKIVIVIEEPEAFLHPSAQRQFMQFLRRALVQKVHSAIITTHSPVIVDESEFQDLVIVRGQKHFSAIYDDKTRTSINTSLISMASSELFFARTIVFVEGEGDKALLNNLLKRIRAKTQMLKELSSLVIQVTGGCTFFSPWLKLCNSFGRSGVLPIQPYWIMDGDTNCSSSSALRDMLKEVGHKLIDQDDEKLASFKGLDWTVDKRNIIAANDVNSVLDKFDGRIFVCDLEWALFNGIDSKLFAELKALIKELFPDLNINEMTKEDLAKKLGSKIVNGKSVERPYKQPFVRAAIAKKLDLSNLPPEIYMLIVRVLEWTLKDATKVQKVISDCELGYCK